LSEEASSAEEASFLPAHNEQPGEIGGEA
jgi:hypothetical protein